MKIETKVSVAFTKEELQEIIIQHLKDHNLEVQPDSAEFGTLPKELEVSFKVHDPLPTPFLAEGEEPIEEEEPEEAEEVEEPEPVGKALFR